MSDDKLENVTPTDSSTEPKTPDQSLDGQSANEDSQPQPPRQLTEEEVAFNALSGSAQDRFRAILREREEYRERLDRLAQQDFQRVDQLHPTPTPTPPQVDDDVKEAVRKLKEVGGMVTQEDLNAFWWAIKNNETHAKLEKLYDGESGTPKYDRVEVEDYARRMGMGNNFLAAYRDMYFDELTDVKVSNKRRQVVSEKPVNTAEREQPLTLSSFRRELRDNPEAYEKYAKDPEQFNRLLEQLTSEE